MRKIKKWGILAVINTMAFGSMLATLYFNFGLRLFLLVLVPSCILFGTNMTVLLSMKIDKSHAKE